MDTISDRQKDSRPERAAEAIGVSRATMYELIHSEGFPTLKVGNRRLISRELLAEWVRRQANAGDG